MGLRINRWIEAREIHMRTLVVLLVSISFSFAKCGSSVSRNLALLWSAVAATMQPPDGTFSRLIGSSAAFIAFTTLILEALSGWDVLRVGGGRNGEMRDISRASASSRFSVAERVKNQWSKSPMRTAAWKSATLY